MAHITQARNSNVLETFKERRTTPIGHSGRCSTRRLDGGGCQSKPARGGKEGREGRKRGGGKRGSESAGLVEEEEKKKKGRGGRGERDRGQKAKCRLGARSFACARTESSPHTHTHTHTRRAGMRLNLSEAQPLLSFASVYTLFFETRIKKVFWGFEATFKGDARRASSRFGAQLWQRTLGLSRDTFAGRVT